MKRRFIVKASTSVRAAEDKVEDTRVEDLASALKDDFNLAIDTLDKLARDGKVTEALSIMSTLSDNINHAIEDAAEQVVE